MMITFAKKQFSDIINWLTSAGFIFIDSLWISEQKSLKFSSEEAFEYCLNHWRENFIVYDSLERMSDGYWMGRDFEGDTIMIVAIENEITVDKWKYNTNSKSESEVQVERIFKLYWQFTDISLSTIVDIISNKSFIRFMKKTSDGDSR